jgi:hypothetical protein
LQFRQTGSYYVRVPPPREIPNNCNVNLTL